MNRPYHRRKYTKFNRKRSRLVADNYNDYCDDDDHSDEKVDDQEECNYASWWLIDVARAAAARGAAGAACQ